MGIFSKLFGNKREPRVTTHDAEEGQYSKFTIPGLYVGMKADVVNDQGVVLMELRVKEFTPSSVTFQHINGYGEIMVLPINEDTSTFLFFRGYSEEHKPVRFSGLLKESNSRTLRVTELLLTEFDEHREQFRLPLQTTGEVTYSISGTSTLELCVIKDVSSGGACFLLAKELKESAKVTLGIPFSWTESKDGEGSTPIIEMNLNGFITRVTERPGEMFEYGVQFTSLTEALRSELLTNLYSVQMRWRKERQRMEEGIY